MKLLVRPHPLLLVGVALVLGGCASSSPPATRTRAATAATPAEWRHTATRDFERDFPGKGLGVARRYDSEDGWADVYIYDLGRSWQDGRADPEFASAFASACDDIRATAAAGHYSGLEADAPQDGMAGALPVRWMRFTYRHQGKPIESYLLMTCVGGRILKARASFFVPVSTGAWDSIRLLVNEQVRLIR